MNIEDVVVVGGGPVGLFLGLCLHHRGIPCTIIEQRTEIMNGSRSLGIHPVSLELFEKLGMEDPFLQAGLKVHRGHAHSGKKQLGTIDFSSCLPPYNFILLLAQSETERILKEELLRVSPHSIIEGAEVTHLHQEAFYVQLEVNKEGETHSLETGYVVGCDGKHSFVRESAGISFKGKRYPDTYLMGDFKDSTHFGDDAVVYLPKDGLIECFPLPDNMRRWVAKTPSYVETPSPELLSELIKQRIDVELDASTCTTYSGFGVQHYIADRFVVDRILLAGDAAHVVSPIGGQGMNLGWLDAWHLANVMSFCRGISKDLPLADMFVYESKQKPMARKVARRAELNMRMGRATHFPWLKNQWVSLLTQSPLQKNIAEFFTMRGLENWWM
jgi:2-polyprenyl-6-methoxyphenol hydroxylase-like FAD-dependent oxidoreductase